MGMLGLNAAHSAPIHEKHHVAQKRHVLANKKTQREGVAHIVRTSEVKTEPHRAKTRVALRKSTVRKTEKARVEPVSDRKVRVSRSERGRVEHVSWGRIPVNIKVRDDVVTQKDSDSGLFGKLFHASAKVPAAAEDKPYSGIINHYAETYGVPVSLAHAVVHHESDYNADVRGSAGEIGLMQVKLSTARSLGYTGTARGLYNPVTNVQYGMKYLAMAQRLSGGSVCGTILKYNAGHGATRMNPISARYCNQVKVYMRSF
ncbi:transglycosylase-like protein with SLT domain [Phyllobacterium leguminum]|uniref:Transglycosylase-like protein with SLT domain n=1 Tax=Phyllobacterium leguminum TaxID=314237 RepID=A0A318T9K8_9HYPH|nr:transglycosylase-like protein with SLT domain [Phyllobacterium leguminum]